MMGDVGDASAIFVESSRFWVQRVVVPILVCVGVVGNVISVIILTRYEFKFTNITCWSLLANLNLQTANEKLYKCVPHSSGSS